MHLAQNAFKWPRDFLGRAPAGGSSLMNEQVCGYQISPNFFLWAFSWQSRGNH